MSKMTKTEFKNMAVSRLLGVYDVNAVRAIECIMSVIYDVIYNPELTLKVVRSDEAKEFPLIAVKKDGDVGYDLPCIIDEDPVLHERSVVLFPNERVKLRTGIKFQIPDGYWVEIKARSSTGNLMCITPDAVIDEKYRGEVFPIIMNVGKETVKLFHGERYVQAIFHKKCNDNLHVVEVDELEPSERGESGFGSTGK